MQENTDKYIAPIKGRIRKYLDFKGIKLSIFFSETGVAESAFRGRAARSEFGGEILSTIVRTYPDLSARWLLTGEDDLTPEAKDSIMGRSNIMAKSGSNVVYNHTCAEPCVGAPSLDQKAGVIDLVDTIKAQLEEKDRQLSEKDKQIEMLHQMLAKWIEIKR